MLREGRPSIRTGSKKDEGQVPLVLVIVQAAWPLASSGLTPAYFENLK